MTCSLNSSAIIATEIGFFVRSSLSQTQTRSIGFELFEPAPPAGDFDLRIRFDGPRFRGLIPVEKDRNGAGFRIDRLDDSERLGQQSQEFGTTGHLPDGFFGRGLSIRKRLVFLFTSRRVRFDVILP